MRLAIVIPTYNRSRSLERALTSILRIPIPVGHSITVAVCDNNSTDHTLQTVRLLIDQFEGRMQYISANRGQGRSYALNAGIRATESELVGFIDDDEELHPEWAEVTFRAFRDPDIHYIGGRYEPVWETPPPAWVDHPHTRTAVGWADFGAAARSFDEEGFDGLAMGGNSIIRRSCFEKVGLYSEDMGRSGNRLLGAEDSDMQDRLMAAGFRGFYLPDLAVYHYIPKSRLTKRYMRRWAFWTSVSSARMALRRPQTGPHWFALPRSMYGRLLRAPYRLLGALAAHKPADAFNNELTFWRFAGFFYGAHLLPNRKWPGAGNSVGWADRAGDL